MIVSNATPATLPYATPSHSVPERLRQEQADAQRNPAAGPVEQRAGTTAAQAASRVAETRQPGALTPEEEQRLKYLKKRDAEVRRHEQQHLAAAGPYGKGSPHYDYETGPDGKRYAVAGQTKIDTTPVAGDPEATLAKARVLKRAALAPADPSTQDRRVAAEAARMEAQARKELTARTDDAGPASTETTAPDAAAPADTPVSPGGLRELHSDPSVVDKIKGKFFILVSRQGNWQGLFAAFPPHHNIDRYA